MSGQKTPVKRNTLFLVPAAILLLAGGAGLLRAQLDGAERGIAPIDSTTNLEVSGVQVDVTGDNSREARIEGWRRAQGEGWKMLWARTTGRPPAQAPQLSASVLNSIVSGIVIEHEQIGPKRYVARLGVLFDRARTGQMLGVEGLVRRSAPVLVVPVLLTGSTPYSFEFRNPWQRAWAQFRTASSPIDYVRTSGGGIDPLLLNPAQARRRGRGWWRMLLDQYGAADIVIPEVELKRLHPGGPALGIFTARFGPDGEILGRFSLRVANSSLIPNMMAEGVRRMDAIYSRALDQGRLRPDPSLVIIEPEVRREVEEAILETAVEPVAVLPPPSAAIPVATVNIQVQTPDPAAVQRAEISVSRVSGVTSAITTSLALGGTSVMRVTFMGDANALRDRLREQGWEVQQLGDNSLRISR